MNFERDNIRAMSGYSYGEQPADNKVIKLNTNENPFPPTPQVDKVLQTFSSADLRRYPPATADGFRQCAAKLHGVEIDNIIATRGGDELLRLLITTFVDPGEVIGMTEPTYSLYPVLAQIQNARTLAIPLDDASLPPADFARQLNAAGTKLTFVVNPHAPTGQLVPESTIRKLADEIDSILLVDEAYIDFVNPELSHNCLDLVRDHDNVIFLRTLSKGYGLAGLRFGYGIGHKQLIQPMLEKTRDSYNLDALSQQIAEAALADQHYASETWKVVRQQREELSFALTQLGFSVSPSEANFLLATVPTAHNLSANLIYQNLKAEGILVRYFTSLNDKIRITVGKPEENKQLVASLKTMISTLP